MTRDVPRLMGHIWIGPKPAPDAWMRSWPEKHPGWDYRIYDNNFLETHPFRTRRLINEYFWRGEYAGVQDLMRYEILHEFGGFMADADSICLHPIDELLTGPGAYTVYDRPDPKRRGVSPFLACEPGNPLVGAVIDRLCQLEPWEMRAPTRTTGNLFLMSMVREWGEDQLTIWPSHYFIPWHHADPDNVYRGPDKIYAEQKWGSATWSYNRGGEEGSQTTLSRNEKTDGAAELCARLARRVQPALDLNGLAEAAARFDGKKTAPKPVPSEWDERLGRLNAMLVDHMRAAGVEPVFHGLLFYRDRQRHLLTESPLITRTAALRDRLATILAQARRTLQIGVDTGHLLLLHKCLAPDAEIVAFDACQPAPRNATRVDLYVPAAMNWLGDEFSQSVSFLRGRPGRAIPGYFATVPGWSADLLHFNGVDENFLKSYGAAIDVLDPTGQILIHDQNSEVVQRRVEELQMIGEVAEPAEFREFGPGGGAYVLLRRRSKRDRDALARSVELSN